MRTKLAGPTAPPIRLVRFRLSLESAELVESFEKYVRDLGALDIDVDPDSGLVDPLTLRVSGKVALSATVDPALFASLLGTWWTQTGRPGVAVGIYGARISVVQSKGAAGGEIAIVGLESFPRFHSPEDPAQIAELLSAAAQAGCAANAGGDMSAGILEPTKSGFDTHQLSSNSEIDLSIADEHGIRAAIVQSLWDALCSTVGDEPVGRERAAAAKVRFESRPSMTAFTIWNGQPTVRIDIGMIEAITECARSVVGEVYDPDYRGAVGAETAFDEAALRLAHVLGWLTSVAQYPVPTPDHHLPAKGEAAARLLATGGVLFCLAHELAHVMTDDGAHSHGRASSHTKELEADRRAVAILRAFLAAGPPTTDSASGLAGAGLTEDLIIAGSAMFLSFEGLRQLAFASARREIPMPWPVDVTAETETASHPSPFTRLKHLCGTVAEHDVDGAAVEVVNGMVRGFAAFRSVIERNLPEWSFDLEDAREWIGLHGFDPDNVSALVGVTLQDIQAGEVLEVLRLAAARGAISESEITYLSECVGFGPRPVIDTLALARVGIVPSDYQPFASQMRDIALEVSERIQPLMLRLAIRANPDALAAANNAISLVTSAT